MNIVHLSQRERRCCTGYLRQ